MIEDHIKLLIAALTANTEAIKDSGLTHGGFVGGGAQLSSLVELQEHVNSIEDHIDPNEVIEEPPFEPDVNLDVDKLPWDARIHSGNQQKTEGGKWKQLRQPKLTFPDKAVWLQYIKDVRAELLGGTVATQPEAIVDGVEIPPGVHNSDNMTKEYAGMNQDKAAPAPAPAPAPIKQEPVMLPGAKGISYESYKDAGWTDDALIDAQMMEAPKAPEPINTVTIDDIRSAMQDLSAQKGAAAIVGCIAKYGRKLDEIDPSRLGELLQVMNECPDITVPPPPA